eukprot:4031949-Pyramimonas_sp.AAC.1
MVSLKNLVRDSIPIWRSANDVVMTAGRNGRIPPTHIVQLIGILPSTDCQINRVGQVWVNPFIFAGQQSAVSDGKMEEMHEIRNGASSLRNWFFPNLPYYAKCPDPPPVQE